MAKYKCLPSYEYIENGKKVASFDLEGLFETEEKEVIAKLDAVTEVSPFIKRLDKPAPKVEAKAEPKAEQPKPKPKSKAKSK
jgi:hypothetical protein